MLSSRVEGANRRTYPAFNSNYPKIYYFKTFGLNESSPPPQYSMGNHHLIFWEVFCAYKSAPCIRIRCFEKYYDIYACVYSLVDSTHQFFELSKHDYTYIPPTTVLLSICYFGYLSSYFSNYYSTYHPFFRVIFQSYSTSQSRTEKNGWQYLLSWQWRGSKKYLLQKVIKLTIWDRKMDIDSKFCHNW